MRLLLAVGLSVVSLAAQTFTRATAMDAAINQAVREGRIPGAVVLVGHEGKVIYQKAYGNRSLAPAREAMTLDTIFDIASPFIFLKACARRKVLWQPQN